MHHHLAAPQSLRRQVALFLLLTAAPAHGTTRLVPEQYPTIGAALALSAIGDSVLVQPGVYPEHSLTHPGGVALIGLGESGSVIIQGDHAHRLMESGAQVPGTLIKGIHFQGGRAASGGALRIWVGDVRVESCLFTDNEATTRGGALELDGAGAGEVIQCTFAHNRAPLGSALCLSGAHTPAIENTLISLNTNGAAVELGGTGLPVLQDCDIADNPHGDWTGFLANYLGILGNIEVTPRFCRPTEDDWRLSDDSVCLPGHNPDGEWIGALGAGCDAPGLQAQFSFAPGSGGTPLLVEFTDQSAGQPDTWEWDFQGDGQWTVGGPVVDHSYPQADVVRPRLRVRQGDVLSEVEADATVTARFEVDFQADDTVGNIPLPVHFEATVVGTPTEYEWEFGDGETQVTDEAEVEHVYPVAGTFSVRLTMRDGLNEAQRFRQDYVHTTADTLRVPGDVVDLQHAFPLVGEGTVLLLGPGTHDVTVSLHELPAGVQVLGPAAPDTATVRLTQFNGSVLMFNGAGAPCRLERVTIATQRGQLGVEVRGRTQLEVRDCHFLRSDNPNSQQGVLADDSSHVLVSHCIFTGLVEGVTGSQYADLQVEDCSFTLQTDYGTAIASEAFSRLRVERCEIQGGNQAIQAGGATMVLRDCQLRGATVPLMCWLDTLLVEDTTIRGCRSPSTYLVYIGPGTSTAFDRLVMTNNESLELPPLSLIQAYSGAHWTLNACLLAGNGTSRVLSETSAPPEAVTCCDLFGNEGGNWTGPLAPFAGTDGNLELDPQFCDLEADTLALAVASPCLPDNNACGVAMGGLAEGCTVTAVQAAFSASVGFGVVPLTVSFQESSTGPVEEWSWDFDGDGDWDSQEQNPTHTYTEDGQWAVRLRVANSEYSSTLQVPHCVFSHIPRNLRVPQDYATIAAALAAVDFADTVLVACGVYHEHDLVLPDWVTVRSATGEPTCVTLMADGLGRVFLGTGLSRGFQAEGLTLTGGVKLGGGFEGMGGAALLTNSNGRFTRCVFRGNQARFGGAGAASTLDSLVLERCVLTDNSCLSQSAGWMISGGATRLERCLVTNNSGATLFSAAPQISCSDLFGNSHGNWTGPWANQLGLNGNIEADPLYCDAANGNFGLQADSPCLPPASACGAMGVWDGDCLTNLPDIAGPPAFAVEAWPNPFNPSTTLSFTLSEAAQVEVRLYNVMGQCVGTVCSGPRAAGAHSLRVDGSRLAGGIYLLKLEAGTHSVVKKLTLLK